jgi:2-polyprenyl-3-methyl-5-hydroxy-6-metoxy-1,4-benzoquinol methylase
MKEFWNERYSEENYVYGEEPNDFLKEHIQIFPKEAKILCLADGEGRNGVFLASNGFDVSSVDLSEAGKSKALKLAGKKGVAIDYDIADLNDYDMGVAKWDGIISIFSHTPSAVRRRVLSAVKQALKPGGIFLLEGYNAGQLKYGTGGPKDEDMLFSLDELKTAFSDCKILRAENLVRDVNEGAYHWGESSVVQFIVQK